MSRNDVVQLFRIIDWMMELPEALGQLFDREVEQIDQERHMPYVTSIERHGEQRDRADMLIRALEGQYRVSVPEDLAARIRGTEDTELLVRWFNRVFEAESLEEFQQRMEPLHEQKQQELIRAIERPFWRPVPEELVARIQATTDTSLLGKWLDLVYTTATLEEFQQRVQS